MLVFPQWRSEVAVEGCRLPRWLPAERFAPYIARTVVLPPTPPQVEDEDSGDSCAECTGPAAAERTGPAPTERTRTGPAAAERTRTGPAPPAGEWSACGWVGCGARVPGVARLSAHVARTHALAHRDGMFYCRWEGCARPLKGFNARYKMLVHVRTHTNERPHRCAQCDKCFSRAENLKIHLRSHSGEKPYVCPYEGCGKAYSNSSDRFKHTRTHTVDKPYCCKVNGCNKRYTDPSSLRKHVKTYRHFTPKDTHKPDETSDGTSSPGLNSSRYVDVTPTSPQLQLAYSPPGLSPTIPPYNPILPLSPPASTIPLDYTPLMDRVTYIKTLEPMYPLPHEMSYMEYTQMYEHAYRNYYSDGLTYPMLRPSVEEKRFAYEHQRLADISMEVMESQALPVSYRPIEHEMPLNLKCERRLECKPIEELMRRTDLPLDLSINVDSAN